MGAGTARAAAKVAAREPTPPKRGHARLTRRLSSASLSRVVSQSRATRGRAPIARMIARTCRRGGKERRVRKERRPRAPAGFPKSLTGPARRDDGRDERRPGDRKPRSQPRSRRCGIVPAHNADAASVGKRAAVRKNRAVIVCGNIYGLCAECLGCKFNGIEIKFLFKWMKTIADEILGFRLYGGIKSLVIGA